MPTKRIVLNCPLSAFVNMVSGKWAIPILYRLIVTDGPIRYRDLQRLATPITQKELTKQLRILEERGLVSRTVYEELPARVEYEATAEARQLLSGLEGLALWMRDHGWNLVENYNGRGKPLSKDLANVVFSRPIDDG